MYLGALGGGKVGEWKGWPGMGPINQEAVNRRWAEIGQPPPAPLVPEFLIGLYQLPSRGPRMFGTTKKGKPVKFSKADGKRMADFFNFWGKVAVDPYRKQSGISKVAGGILQVVSVAIPQFAYFQAAAEAGNAGLAYGKQGGDAKLAERVMTPAVEAQAAKEDAKAKSDFDAKIQALQAFAPVPNAGPATFAPILPTAQVVDLTPKPVAPKAAGWTNEEIGAAAILGGVLLLGVLRR